MEYHIFTVRWSQTDSEKYIIIANSKAQAVKFANDMFNVGTPNGARYVEHMGFAPIGQVHQVK